jgi:ribose-phosphate pyrophosphokinase
MLETMGVDRVVAVDLHASQMQGFFHPNVPMENLESTKVGANYFADTFPDIKQPMVVAIRTYSVARAKEFQKSLHVFGGGFLSSSIL